jgi:hypothetical protein
MKIQIKSFSDLVDIAKSDRLTPEQFQNVLSSCKPFQGIFVRSYSKTSEMAKYMEPYLNKKFEGIFWDAGSLDVEEEKK